MSFINEAAISKLIAISNYRVPDHEARRLAIIESAQGQLPPGFKWWGDTKPEGKLRQPRPISLIQYLLGSSKPDQVEAAGKLCALAGKTVQEVM